MPKPSQAPTTDELCIALGGGGARGAYQVGVLRGIARHFPDLEVPLYTGVSAGGINAAHLANHTGNFQEKVEALVELWNSLTIDQVFDASPWSLARNLVRWGVELAFLGGRTSETRVRGFVDTRPLRDFLREHLTAGSGDLTGIAENLDAGRLKAVALSTTCYSTGQTTTWYEGRQIEEWERPNRVGVSGELRIEHVMASAALPLFFPAVMVGDDWYGDGGVRLTAPLAPSIHLGAGRVLAVSTRYGRSVDEARQPNFTGYPAPAQIVGLLMNAIFLDLLDHDAAHLERINDLLMRIPPEAPPPFRQVDLFVVRPSHDIGKLAQEYEPALPKAFRFLTRRLGTQRSRSSDLLSLLMFEPSYLRRLIAIGEQDARAGLTGLQRFLA